MVILSANIEITSRDVDFWTNGDELTGVVVSQCEGDRKVRLQLVRVCLTCEEWVHTGSLEFKEHCRRTERVWPMQQQPSESLVDSNKLSSPLKIMIPPQKSPKKYPPSFSLRYNSISWCIKVVIVYTEPGSSDIHACEVEKPFRSCTKSEKKDEESSTPTIEQLPSDEYSYSVRKKDFKPVQIDPDNHNIPNGEASVDIDDSTASKYHLVPAPHDQLVGLEPISLQSRLRIPQSGSSQRPGRSTPIFLDAFLNGCKELEITELCFSIIESADTYYKDPLISYRDVKRQESIVSTEGDNKLDTRIEASKLSGLTEDFKTEWQNITHVLKLVFLCRATSNDTFFTSTWEVPTRVLSEAECVNYV